MNLTKLRDYNNKQINIKTKILKALTGKTVEENILTGLELLLWFELNKHKIKEVYDRLDKAGNASNNAELISKKD